MCVCGAHRQMQTCRAGVVANNSWIRGFTEPKTRRTVSLCIVVLFNVIHSIPTAYVSPCNRQQAGHFGCTLLCMEASSSPPPPPSAGNGGGGGVRGASQWIEAHFAYSLVSPQTRWRHLMKPTGSKPTRPFTLFFFFFFLPTRPKSRVISL